jgi:serine/threonine-protein kinase
MKLLSKNPEDRYPDAEALAEDLWQVRSGLPVAAAAGTAVGADEARTVEAPTSRFAPAARRKAPARAKRSRAPFVLAALLLLLGLAGVGLALADGSGTGVAVPRVEGLPRDDAVSRLESEGFRTEVRTGDGGGEAGTVTGQSPPGGELAREGSTVTLTVAASTVSVPDVVGQAYADAEAELQGAGLAVGSVYDVQSESAAEGVVVEQGFAAGAEVQPGTSVNLGLGAGQSAPASASPAASPDASASQDADSSTQPSDPSADASASAETSASPEADAQSEEDREAAEENREAAQKAREEAQKAREEAREEAQKQAEEEAEARGAGGPKADRGKGKAKGKE